MGIPSSRSSMRMSGPARIRGITGGIRAPRLSPVPIIGAAGTPMCSSRTVPPEDNPTAGVYEALLTNYAGTDDDDDARYLKYAAYGLFRFIDTNTTQIRPGRIQAVPLWT